MAFDIYTFGSGSYVVEALHAVKMFMGSSSYTTLVRIAGLIGLLWVMLAALRNKSGGSIQADWSWLLFFMFFYVGLIVPKVDVIVNDPLDPPTTASPVVTGVPLGLGFLAYVTSGIGKGLVDNYETFITIPGDQKYSENGMLFGANVMRSFGEMEFPDARFSSDMNQFIGHCLFPQITAGNLSIDAFATGSDLWTHLKTFAQTNRWIEFQNGTTFTCRDAANDLDTRTNGMTTQVNNAAGQAGQKIWPTKGVSDAQAAFLASAGGTTATNFLGYTQTGADLTRQAMMIKAVSGALEGASIDSDNQSMAQAVYQAKAESQQRNTYIMMGNTASRTLPVMKAVMEAIAYAIAPLIFLFILMPGGVVAFGQYAMFLVWLQMWPILYAIINSVMYWYGSQSSLNAALLSDGAHGLTLESMNSINAVNADMVALAGYMAISIPMISYMLLKGGMAAGGAVYSGLMQPSNSTAAAAASEQTSGAMNMNSLTMDNASWGGMNANKMDINRSMASGMTSVTNPQTGATHTSLGSSGNMVTNMSQGISSYAFGTQLSNKVAEGLTTKAESSRQAARSDAEEAVRASGAAFNSMQSYSNELQSSISNGMAHQTAESSNLQKSLQSMANAQQQLATSLGTDVSTAASIMAAAAAKGGKPIEVSAGIDAKGVAKASENWQAVQQFAKDTGYAENLSTATALSTTLSSTQQDGVSDKTAQNVQASISESATASSKAAASYQTAENYAVAASHAKEVSMTSGGDISNEVIKKLGISQYEFAEMNAQAAAGDEHARFRINSLQERYINSFGNEAGFKGAPTADNVEAKWQQDSGDVRQYGAAMIDRHDVVNQGQINERKAEAGLPTRSEIEADAAARQQGVNNGMNTHQSGVSDGRDSMEGKWQQEGGKIEDKATRSTTGVVLDESKELVGEAAGAVAENPKALISPAIPGASTLRSANAIASAVTGKDYLNEALTPASDAAEKLNKALAAPPRERFTNPTDDDEKKSPVSNTDAHEGSGKVVGGNVTRYDSIIQEAATKYDLDPDIIRSMMKQESRGNPNATSPKGAGGLMQLMPATAEEVAAKQGMGHYDRYDPRDNIMMGAAYMKEQMNKYGDDMSLALAAYNAGPGAVDKYDGIPPFKETRDYVAKITKTYQKLKA
ncbi:conjugal transfer protein TraG N-terminal domain-containing protein [Thiothrix sp.]|jgi:soluble lytic murein transglycosylase-like protein|uniref:conjugal transfer protein TraG N-terminal domain-containing protein n=1 Tax=Thiothrix sp. TaxID=1032 RepID=UPI00257A6618|nr:conjugal transfer protein TraG N-terminal domain-containing protein [Thiothrix sp.]